MGIPSGLGPPTKVQPPYSNLDLVKSVDCYPYDSTPENIWSLKYRRSPPGDELILGYMLSSYVEALQDVPESIRGPIEIDTASRSVFAFEQPTEAERSAAAAAVMSYWRERHTFDILEKWRDELWPVYENDTKVLFNVERAGAGLLGIMRYGIHMTAWVKDAQASYGMKIWVPRRAYTKGNFPGMLDNTVAGGLVTGEDPKEAVKREAQEEASLPLELTNKLIRPIGTVAYIYIADKRAGGSPGSIYPELQWNYEMELPPDVIPKVNDGEVADFYLWTVEQAQAAMARGEFKPNCAVMLIDFLLQKGIITPENEPDYDWIVRRLHRKDFPFPGPIQAINRQPN